MREKILCSLCDAAEERTRAFNQRIISDTGYPILGVKMPVMRRLAKKAAPQWRELLSQARFESYEETVTVGLALAYGKQPLGDKLDALRQLLPRLDSWGMTDTIVPTLKVRPEDLGTAWDFAGECLDSDLEYTVRFGIIMMLDYFLIAQYIPQVVERIVEIRDRRYYVQMAAAWLLAELGTQDFERVMQALRDGTLDVFTHNMTIRKMRESYRITPEQKQAAAALNRKEEKK